MRDSIESSDLAERHSPTWAQWVSDVFSPLLIPVYGMVIALWCTDMRSLPEDGRVIATIIVGIISGFIPFVTIAFLIKTGKVHTRSIANPRERFLPMSIGAVCYLAAGTFVKSAGAPMWLVSFFVAAAIATGIAMAVTTRWKISAHATAVGGLAGMTAWCVCHGTADIEAVIELSIVILIAGLVATSRLLLQRHTMGQVLAGLALGFACCFSLMFI
ncbi:MAG: phosphatase PAP2 family protein [Muribaculaceae bacterium]|nr:phosphatase PAP2 family protein [Muribaculaceae bacterium]